MILSTGDFSGLIITRSVRTQRRISSPFSTAFFDFRVLIILPDTSAFPPLAPLATILPLRKFISPINDATNAVAGSL